LTQTIGFRALVSLVLRNGNFTGIKAWGAIQSILRDCILLVENLRLVGPEVLAFGVVVGVSLHIRKKVIQKRR
jgi:hypothetical protein